MENIFGSIGMYIGIFWFFFLLSAICVNIFIAIQTYAIARDKGYCSGWWVVAGLAFGFIALLTVAGLPDKITQTSIKQLIEDNNKFYAQTLEFYQKFHE